MRSSPPPAYRRALTVTAASRALLGRAAGPADRRYDVMAALEEPGTIDGAKLEAFVFHAADEIAQRTGTAERYVREWLNNQAAGGYVEYDPATGRYTLPPEQAVALTDENSPAYIPGFFQIAIGSVLDSPRITEAVRTGEG